MLVFAQSLRRSTSLLTRSMSTMAPPPGVVCEGEICKMVPAATTAETGAVAIRSLLGDTLLSGNSEFKATHPQADNFDIVFVSSDNDEAQFSKYFATMPFKALPYKDRELKKKLSQRFKVSGIPTLCIIDAETGELISSDGRVLVQQDPAAKLFPWKPTSLQSYLEDDAVNAAGERKPFSDVAGASAAVKALYFSAAWCPPCQRFTPALIEFYNSVRGTDREFEVLFVSRDRSPQDHAAYLSKMPWWAVPYEETDTHMELLKRFDVQSIPTLVLLDQSNKIITSEGVDLLRGDPTGAGFPWSPKPVEVLTPAHLPALNESVCCVYFLADNTAAGVQTAEDKMIGPAMQEFTKDDPEIKFLIADPGSDLGGKILTVLKKTGASFPMLVMLQLPKFAIAKSPDDVEAFVQLWKADGATVSSL